VIGGRCLSYGEGISYWPVTAAVKELLGATPEARLAELGLDPATARALAPILGQQILASSPEEIAWAVIFVASDQANFMTGETVYVSGGPRVANRED